MLALLLLATFPAAGEIYYYNGTGPAIPVDETNPKAFAFDAQQAKSLAPKQAGISWNISYRDIEENANIGFDDPAEGAERRARVEEVLSYLSGVLAVDSPVSLDIQFDRSQTDGSGFLASAGTFFSSAPGFTGGFAFDHIATQQDPSGSLPDIFAQFDFGWNWNASPDPPANNEIDLMSVLLHEFTHGLGFLSLAESDGSSSIARGVYTHFDNLLFDGNSRELFILQGTRAVYRGDSNTLTGGDGGVFFVGPATTAVFGADPPIYTPSAFSDGSSVSHWDYPAGAPVMLPAIGFGDTRREYLDFEIAALNDLGYPNAQALGTAAFSADIRAGEAPLTVQFTDESTLQATAWLWDFDSDGKTDSVLQNPTHTYDEPGSYTVRLEVSNAKGSNATVKEDFILVTAALPLSPGTLGSAMAAAAIWVLANRRPRQRR